MLGDVAAAPAGSSTPKTCGVRRGHRSRAPSLAGGDRALPAPTLGLRADGSYDRPDGDLGLLAGDRDRGRRRDCWRNPGGFIPLALKDISQTGPTAAGYVAEWVGFALVSLLPLSLALVMLALAPRPTKRVLTRARCWLERHAMTLAAAILALLAVALLRNGIAGLTG